MSERSRRMTDLTFQTSCSHFAYWNFKEQQLLVIIIMLFNLPLSVGSEQGPHSRPEAEAVWGAVDHDLTERGHNNQDEDGHDLHEESEASLRRKHFSMLKM